MAGNRTVAAAWLAGFVALLAAFPAGNAAWAQSSGGGDVARYTVFIVVREPVAAQRAQLQALLKADGYPSHAEGENEIALVLTAADLRRLFQAHVRFHSVEAGASPGTRRRPHLRNATIPPRLRGLVEKVYFDPQRS